MKTNAGFLKLSKTFLEAAVHLSAQSVKIRSFPHQLQVKISKAVKINVIVIGNYRSSGRVFLRFYSAVFKLTSAKFQIFVYISRTARSSFMKFWQQFEISKLYACAKFRGNRSRDFSFKTRKSSPKFDLKSGLIQKQLKYGKKIFHVVISLTYPFIATNRPLAALRFVFFFFVTLHALLLNRKPSKSNFCVKLLKGERNFASRILFGSLPQKPPKINFLNSSS